LELIWIGVIYVATVWIILVKAGIWITGGLWRLIVAIVVVTVGSVVTIGSGIVAV
jgi:hypothetical protein